MANKIDFKIGPGIGISAHSLYIVSTSDGAYNSGAVRIAGGASIGRTLSLSGSLLLQNGANYTALKSSASSNTIYTLPNQYPATGTSVLQSDTTGQMTWVPMVASVGGGSGSGTVDYGLQYRLATYPAAGTLVTNSDLSYNPSTTRLSFSNLTFVGNGNSAISISGVSNGGQILTTWDTLNSGLSLDALNASLRIVGDTNAGTTLVDLGVYDNSGFPTGNWNSKYLFPKTTNAIFVNGLSITNATGSTSTSTGALIVSGGVGIGGSLFVTSSLPSSLSGVVVNNGVVTSGTWAGSLITGLYGGTGYNSYTKGDILVGAGNTFIKLPIGTNNYVLTASSSTATGLIWSPTASTGITTLNGLTDTIQYFSIGYSGNVPSFSSSGSTHTLNIPIAGTGSTGLVSTQTQSFAGSKTFTNAVSITDNTGSGSYTSGALIVTGGVGIGGTLNVQGDLNVQGTFTTINSTTLTVADKNIEMGSVGSPSDLTAQGGGITLKGATDKSINWYSGVGWSSSENFNIASGNVYKINNVEVLSSTRLNTGVIFSSIQTAGIITSGTWAATAITTFYGGTGFSSYTTGDILAGAGTTLIKVAIGSNNFVLTADNTVPGGVKWAAAVSSGSAITAQNINVSAATTNATHYIIFSPSITGSGVALSTEPALVYNPSTDILSASGIAITSSTASGSTSSGALTVVGGVGIGQSVSVGGRLQLFNGANFTAFISSATANTVYTLPATSPATGTSYLVSTSTGVMSWSPLPIVTLNGLTPTTQTFAVGTSGSGFTISSSGSIHTFNIPIAGTAATGLVSTLAQSFAGLKTFTNGLVSQVAIGQSSGGTGFSTYITGDILVGAGSTILRLPVGLNNYALLANSSSSTGVSWGLIPTASLQTTFIGLGNTTVGLGNTLGIIGTGISITYEDNNLKLRSAVAITSSYPTGALQGDLLWHDEEGSLKIYYDDGQNEGQWVDASQRWGSGQYITLPGLGAGTVYQMAYYAASGHTVVGDASFINDTSIGRVTVSHGSGSTSTSTGAFVVSGSAGIGGTLFANSVRTDSGFIEKVFSGGIAGTGSTIYANWNNGSVQTYTIAGNCWLGLPINMPTGASLTLVLSQNSVGGWGITSDTNIKYAAGNKTISTSANAIDVINMFYTGSAYLAALTTGYS